MSNDWPAGVAADLLDSAIACYSDSGAPTIPDRQFLTHGNLPALDCPALAVTVTNLQARQSPPNRCTVEPRLRLFVWVVRCYPTLDDNGNPPPSADETAAAKLLQHDLGTLWDGLTERWAKATLFPSFDAIDCERVTFEMAQPMGPLGGTAGWSMPILVDVSGVR